MEAERLMPDKFAGKVSSSESYVMHLMSTRIGKKKEQRVLLLTRKSLYQFNPYDNSLISRVDLREVYRTHSIQGLTGVTVVFLVTTLNLKRVKVDGWGTGDASWKSTKRVDFLIDSVETSFDFAVALSQVLTDRWQQLWEVDLKVVPAPEIYQEHFFATKVNRKKKLQNRYLVVSTHRIYNVDVGKRGIDPRGTKWSVAFNDILSVTLMTGSDATYGLSLQLYPTAQCVKNKDVRDVFFCMMNTSQERTAFLQVLKRLYLCNTGKFLQEHQTTTKPSNL